MTLSELIEKKRHAHGDSGFKPTFIPDAAFDFQKALIDWSVYKGEQHLCPLQLHTIARAVELWSNPGEVVFTPFLGVGSEVYQAVTMGRRGIGCELKPFYYRQALKNCATAGEKRAQEEMPLFNQPQNDIDGGEME